MFLRIRRTVLVCLGGAVWGSLIGIFLGAILGTIYGAFNGDVSLGLEGALLGCLCLAVAGGVYGMVLEVTAGRRTADEEDDLSATASPHPNARQHANALKT